MGDQVSRQVQTEMRQIQKKASSFARSEEGSERQNQGESKRTRVERGGSNQRSFTPSGPQLAGSRPRPRTRGDKQSGHSHWRYTRPRSPEQQRELARAVRGVSQSTAAPNAGRSDQSPVPPIVPTPGCLERIRRLIRVDYRVGRGTRQQDLSRSLLRNGHKVVVYVREEATRLFTVELDNDQGK